MKTIVDSHMISVQVVEILWFYGIASTQTVDRTGSKVRYVVEVAPADADRARVLFPLRKWV